MRRAWVRVGPPLSARGPSSVVETSAGTIVRSPAPASVQPVLSPIRLLLLVLIVGPKSQSAVELVRLPPARLPATITPRNVSVPLSSRIPPPVVARLSERVTWISSRLPVLKIPRHCCPPSQPRYSRLWCC